MSSFSARRGVGLSVYVTYSSTFIVSGFRGEVSFFSLEIATISETISQSFRPLVVMKILKPYYLELINNKIDIFF